MSKPKLYAKNSMPGTLDINGIYFIKTDIGFDIIIPDNYGVAQHVDLHRRSGEVELVPEDDTVQLVISHEMGMTPNSAYIEPSNATSGTILNSAGYYIEVDSDCIYINLLHGEFAREAKYRFFWGCFRE